MSRIPGLRKTSSYKAKRMQPVVLALAALLLLTGVPNVAGGEFSIVLTKDNKANTQIFDILSGAGRWTFTITVDGKANYIFLSIRDSAPGDFCWGWYIEKKDMPKETFTVTSEPIPEATEDACGTEYEDTNGDELTLTAGFLGGKGKKGAETTVTIIVEYPDKPT